MVAEGDDDLTLRDFLTAGGFSRYFVRHFVVPVVSSVWSAATGVALEYPARYLFVFLDNHGMLSVTGSPAVADDQWRLPRLRRADRQGRCTRCTPGHPYARSSRTAGRVEIRDECDQVATFDRVVMATHADDALRLLDSQHR